jgi:hypothetical protein
MLPRQFLSQRHLRSRVAGLLFQVCLFNGRRSGIRMLLQTLRSKLKLIVKSVAGTSADKPRAVILPDQKLRMSGGKSRGWA